MQRFPSGRVPTFNQAGRSAFDSQGISRCIFLDKPVNEDVSDAQN